jgi:leader peptidase (prepilin peptidase)/N-methyltransferase
MGLALATSSLPPSPAIEIAALTALLVYGVSQFVLRRPLQAAAKLPFGLFFAPAIWIGWLLGALFLQG